MAERQTETVRGTSRVSALDIVRGAVMVLMAIDHVRVYSGVPAGGPTAASSSRAGSRTSAPRPSPFLLEHRRSSMDGSSPALLGAGARQAGHDKRALAQLPRDAGPRPRRPRAHRDSRRVDVRRRLFAVHPGRRHLDARLVHGPARGTDLASNPRHRGNRAARDPLPGRLRPAGTRDPGIVAFDLGISLPRWGRGQAWPARTLGRRALHPRAVDWRDGGRLCLWRDRRSRARRTPPLVPADRALGDGAISGDRRARRIGRRCARWWTAGPAPAPEPAEVSGVTALSADDAGADDRPAAPRRARARLVRRCAGDVRARADVLLPAAHPAHSRRGAPRLARREMEVSMPNASRPPRSCRFPRTRGGAFPSSTWCS